MFTAISLKTELQSLGSKAVSNFTTASFCMFALIGSRKEGIPKDAIRLSTEVMKPHMTNALKSYGIAVERRRSNGKRLLQLSRSVDTSGNMAA